jgi:UDP-N-acetylglucosamine acyltransferase
VIDSRAIIHKSADIATDVFIGPYTVIGKNVKINAGCYISPHVVIGDNTILGVNNRIFQFSSIGEEPIDNSFHGEFSQLIIGNNNIIRECSTIHSGTAKEKGVTTIGNNNLIMNYVHIGHDCKIGNNITFINHAALAGHVIVDDFATIGVSCGVHQFCNVGAYSFIQHMSLIVQDVPPYIIVASSPSISPCGLNVEGLRRSGFSSKTIRGLREAYKIIYRQGLLLVEAIQKLKTMRDSLPEVNLFIAMLENTKRGIVR